MVISGRRGGHAAKIRVEPKKLGRFFSDQQGKDDEAIKQKIQLFVKNAELGDLPVDWYDGDFEYLWVCFVELSSYPLSDRSMGLLKLNDGKVSQSR